MPYLNLNSLVLKSNYSARDLDLINFNATMVTLQVFLNTLKSNQDYEHAVINALSDTVTALEPNNVYIGTTEPENPNLQTIWFDTN